MKRRSLLLTIRNARRTWDVLVASVPHADMTRPGVAGAWSLKDVIAHIVWHERQMIGMLHAHAFTGSPLWLLPLHERNAAIYEENRNRTIEDVQEDARVTFMQLLVALKGVSDDDLADPAAFPGMPPQWQPWQIIAQNTYEHYRHHTEDVRSWLGRT